MELIRRQKFITRRPNFEDYIIGLYDYKAVEKNENFFPIRSVTFQVTNDCCCACSYCYQGNKGKSYMSFEVGKQIIDLLFKMYEDNNNDFINQNTWGIILDFIGGEPLMNIAVIEQICDYFFNRCIETDHKWLYFSRISLITNGAYYFKPEVQHFIQKYKNLISFDVTLDGPKEIHDACRVYHNGKGNFDDAYKALIHLKTHYYSAPDTKVTICKENLNQLNTIIKFFTDLGIDTIHANTAYEPRWDVEDAKIFYQQLKIMADNVLNLQKTTMPNLYVSLFDESLFKPMTEDNNRNWCGGTGAMLAFDPNGVAYPCLRYMPSSLGEEVAPITIGNTTGLFQKDEEKETHKFLDSITRRSQSTDECFNCPIAQGCAWCSAWNYQLLGSPNKRDTAICPMHKARSLANVYYWNKYYLIFQIPNYKQRFLPNEDALTIIDTDELSQLDELEFAAYHNSQINNLQS